MVGTAGLYAQGHFAPGVANIRDYVVPEPGFYGVLYSYVYRTDQLNDSEGNAIRSITINPGPGPGITLEVDVNVNIYTLAPAFTWVSNWKLAGARYAAYILPTFSNSSVRIGRNSFAGERVENETGQFAVGDMSVQPLWLGWSAKHLDVAAGYGFYAPVGKYVVQTYDLPVIGLIKVPAADNIGLGFWTHQLQGAVAVCPWENKAAAITSAWTYEINGQQRDFDITPGSYFTWNWGFSQYLPLSKSQNMLLEIGPCGYSQWQTTENTGNDVRISAVKDRVHAAGFQTGLVYAPWNFAVNFRYQNEFSSSSRFQGNSLGLNLAIKF